MRRERARPLEDAMQEMPTTGGAAAGRRAGREPARTGRAVAATASGSTPGAADGFADPRLLQVLTAEHSSLLTSRSLAYNEAFTRASMFLTFLSMSFVALAVIGPPLAFSRDF